jgi:hypothetical protein
MMPKGCKLRRMQWRLSADRIVFKAKQYPASWFHLKDTAKMMLVNFEVNVADHVLQ